MPLPGLVLRYSYLWADDADAGAFEGGKEQPAVVVVTVVDEHGAGTRVLVLPVTHSAPRIVDEAIEIPADVKRKCGLDPQRSWIILSEFNEFIWPGFDLAVVPGRTPRTFAHWFLTPGFFTNVVRPWLELDASVRSRRVERD